MPKHPTIHFGMLAKYWYAGTVKTRLAKALGNDLACQVCELFVRHLLRRFAEFGDHRTLVFSPPESEQAFAALVPNSWNVHPQSEGDLGSRMETFFRSSAASYSKTILIGSDLPDLPVGLAQQAAAMLDDVDVVLGPSVDGGYYLIAMNQPQEVFSEVTWSSDLVLTQTLKSLDRQGISHGLLPVFNDVDEVGDLVRLQARLGAAKLDGLDQVLLANLNALRLPHD